MRKLAEGIAWAALALIIGIALVVANIVFWSVAGTIALLIALVSTAVRIGFAIPLDAIGRKGSVQEEAP